MTVSDIRACGGIADVYVIKIGCEADYIRMAASAAEEYGVIDILCNSHTMFDGFKASLDQTADGWREIFKVNVTSFFLACNSVLPYMIKNNGGSIINISAVAALTGGAGGAAYCASRHAIVGYTKQLCVDYACKGIRANAIAAGSVMSPVLQAIFEADPHERETILDKIPAKYLAEMDDIAYLTILLASDESKWINGAIIPLDGGRQALG
jgi:3-oxoacyl-[acyl-carrier protein] reductase